MRRMVQHPRMDDDTIRPAAAGDLQDERGPGPASGSPGSGDRYAPGNDAPGNEPPIAPAGSSWQPPRPPNPWSPPPVAGHWAPPPPVGAAPAAWSPPTAPGDPWARAADQWASQAPGWAPQRAPDGERQAGWTQRPRRSRGLGQLAAALLVGLLVFGAGSAFGRVTAPPSSVQAGSPAATAPATIPSAAPSGSSSPGSSSAPGSSDSPSPTDRPAATPLPAGQVPSWDLLDEAYRQLAANYVDPSALDPNVLEQGAIEGLLNAVDDRGHTGYLTPDQVKARDELLAGTFVGIGVVLDDRTGPITIVRVLPDSPASHASLKPGDTILRVDGASVEGLTIAQAVTKVRGTAGTDVTLVVGSPDGSQRTVTMTREKLNLPVVSWAFAPGTKVADVRLESFSSGAAAALLNALKAARAAGATGIILDLRSNPGGFVDEAVKTASQFLRSGVVYVSVNRSGDRTPHDVLPGGTATDLPLVVLVDGQTASSAEIVTGALQDAGRATVIGQTTYGTGTVVATYALSDGSAVTVGVERWLTPKGRAIWREGLTPDQVVPIPTTVSFAVPDDFATLGQAGLDSSPDAQLKAALRTLGSAPAAKPVP